MKQFLLCVAFFASWTVAGLGQQSDFRALALYTTKTEPDHVQFAEGAIKFFNAIAARDHFTFDATTNWDDLNNANLNKYQVVLWLDDFPNNAAQRSAFQNYMERGGAWLGFHVAAYNDADTQWPWFIDFLGGGVFYTNSWPPLPAKLVVSDRTHPATKSLPESYLSPANEWYIWKPSPRLNKDVRVLVSLDPSNYPLGFKDTLLSGDLPVVWTNTKYKMLYMNMGHGDKVFDSATQNKMFEDALLWLGAGESHSESPAASGMLISPRGIAINPKTSKVYAVNTAGGTVMIVDRARRFSTVKVGTDPVAIAVNPATNKIYVGSVASGTVSVIDGATDAVTATLKVGELPYVVALNPVTNRVYVSRTFSNDMTVIDGATNATSILKAGVQADAISVNTVTNRVYLLGYEGDDVTMIDGAKGNLTKVAVGTHLWGVALNSVTNRIYFTNSGKSSIAVLDGATNAVTSVSTGEIPSAVAVDETRNRIYVANYGSDSVTVIDGASNKVIATVKVGSRPQAIAVDPETGRIFVANTHSDNVTVIDGSNDSVIATVKAGSAPYAIAVDAVDNRVYVAGVAGGNLTVIDGTSLTAVPAFVSQPK